MSRNDIRHVHRVWWLRDGERLLSNATSGIIVSNQTLVLQSISRGSSGRYCCEATNKEGTTKSTPFHLKVKFEPICGDGTGRKVLGAAKDEPLKVECRLSTQKRKGKKRNLNFGEKNLQKSITDWQGINESLIRMNLTLHNRRITVKGVYNPSDDETVNVKDQFFEKLNDVISEIGNTWVIFLLGNVNRRTSIKLDNNVVHTMKIRLMITADG
ncbi:hypothetical protein HHI36_003033 [Cryptolaemus montrouzieri]|uniref:Ig-like domain-containing protein n=1 Tax=Cryptolaemus montrouzieri TaxID=559131 RepID=A0ABD2PCR7_9CUCU